MSTVEIRHFHLFAGLGGGAKGFNRAKGLRGRIATLAPILHWRVCHVWEWLKHWAPSAEFGDWSTADIADAYGGDEAEEINARTGCIGCPLAQEEKALDTILQNPRWAYLDPLKGLKPLYRALREPHNRLKKPGLERLKDGSIAKNPQRMGPLTFEARLRALDTVLAIQLACNTNALYASRPAINILNPQEEARIRELIRLETWPDGWKGDEPTADTPMDTVYQNGAVQPPAFPGEGVIWLRAHRFHPEAAALADRHYNRRKVGSPQFVPPGSCLVFLTQCRRAVWVTSWPKPEFVKHAWPGAWVNSLFRREGGVTASELIRSAIVATCAFWSPPAQGIVSFVDPKKVKPTMVRGKPVYGFCYLKAGFTHVGFTKGGLWVWQMLPEAMP